MFLDFLYLFWIFVNMVRVTLSVIHDNQEHHFIKRAKDLFCNTRLIFVRLFQI